MIIRKTLGHLGQKTIKETDNKKNTTNIQQRQHTNQNPYL